MGIFDNVVNKVSSDLQYRAGAGISSGIEKKVKGGIGKVTGNKQPGAKTCPKCKKPLAQEGLKFCPECGEKLVLTCEECGIEYPVGTKFCTQCGKPLKK
jgi:predicted amidophosphoribosyltransferase